VKVHKKKMYGISKGFKFRSQGFLGVQLDVPQLVKMADVAVVFI
jgi:hypothetical protein